MEVKYEYLLKTWGGFWNKHNIEIHKEPEIHNRWFDTKEDRNTEIERLKLLEKTHGEYLNSKGKINDSCIVMSLSEGLLTRYKFVIQSHVKVDDKIKVVENNLGYGFFDVKELDELGVCADYMKEWKWDICADLPDNAQRLYTTLLLR
jgi:hypothetical protein